VLSGLSVHPDHGPEKIATALRADVDEIAKLCADLAAEHGFRIVNPELQPAIVAAREERLRPRQEHRLERTREGLPSTAERPPARNAADAYERHLEEIRRHHPGARHDGSRVDALIAVRLRVTGHGREEVERAIRDRAARQRPAESRNWDEYARRAVSHAFGVSGESAFRQLAKAREVLLKLEGRPRSREVSLEISRARGPSRGR